MFVLFLSSYKFCVCVDNRANITAARFFANANRTCFCLSWSVYRNVTICPGSDQSLSLFVGQRLMAFLQTAQCECNSQSVEGNALCLSMLPVLIVSHTYNSYRQVLWTDLTIGPPVYTSNKSKNMSTVKAVTLTFFSCLYYLTGQLRVIGHGGERVWEKMQQRASGLTQARAAAEDLASSTWVTCSSS